MLSKNILHGDSPHIKKIPSALSLGIGKKEQTESPAC